MCAFPGLTYVEAMSMTLRDRNIFVEAYKSFHKK